VPFISAHRGGMPVDGEPAAERYRRAVALGVDYVEFDVRKTKDQVSIICHDDCTAGGRLIRDFAYEELKEELDTEALTFEDLLDVTAGRVGLHLDLKEPGYEKEIVEAVKERGSESRLVITSEDRVVRKIKEDFPEINTGLSLGDELAGAPPWRKLVVRLTEAFPRDRIERSHADFVAVQWQLADFNVLRYASRRHMPAWVWTVDDEAALERYLADPRVTTVITNYPELAMRLRSAGS
jgi:glycerophosphoryl diester phosphodiesterase